jgi:hypothetical protein
VQNMILLKRNTGQNTAEKFTMVLVYESEILRKLTDMKQNQDAKEEHINTQRRTPRGKN